MSSSNFAATSTDSDDTAASTAQVPAWALVIAWSAEEPHRAGEVAFLPPFQNVLLGRGDQEMEKFVRFGIQRPGEPFAPSPRPGRELFEGTLLSRRQLLLRATADAVEVKNLGKCAMLVNGEEKSVATLGEGDTVVLRSRGTRASVAAVASLSEASSDARRSACAARVRGPWRSSPAFQRGAGG